MMQLKSGFIKMGLFLVTLITLVCSSMAQNITLVAGKGKQTGGEVILTETSAGMFQKGELIFTIASGEAGIYLEDVDIEISGGIKGVKAEVVEGKAGKVILSIHRNTDERGSIKLSHFVMTVDRTVPEGSYDLEISGSAISTGSEKIEIKDFIQVITPNTEECYAGSISKKSSTFTVGKACYTQNSQEIEMDAVPFIENGYMMVPIRYAAEAFDTDILYSHGSLTLLTTDRTISFMDGSSEMIINGSKVGMEMPLVIQNGRTYIAISQLAQLLGVKVEWNNLDKSATFIK